MKKTISLLLTFCLLLAISNVVFARASDYISSYNITVGAKGNGVVNVQATVSATYPTMTTVGFSAIQLYEHDGAAWILVDSYYGKYNSNATSGSYAYSFNYQGKAGKKYYAAATFYVSKSGEGSDSKTLSSSTITAN